MFLDEDAGLGHADGLNHNDLQVNRGMPPLPPEIERIIDDMQAEWLAMKPAKLDPAIERILAGLQTQWQETQAKTAKTIAQTWSEVDAEWETMLNQVETENMWFEFDVEGRLAELKAPEFDWSMDDLAPGVKSIEGVLAFHWDTGEFPALELGFADGRPNNAHTPTNWAYDTPLPPTATRPTPATLAEFNPLDLLEIEVEEPITEDDDGMPITVDLTELLNGNKNPALAKLDRISGDDFYTTRPMRADLDAPHDDEYTLHFEVDEFPSGNTPVPPRNSGEFTGLKGDLSEYYKLATGRLGEKPPRQSMSNSTFFAEGEFPSGNTPVPPRNSGEFTGLTQNILASVRTTIGPDVYELAAEKIRNNKPRPSMSNSAPAPSSKPPTIGDQSLASRAKEGAKALWGKVRSWF